MAKSRIKRSYDRIEYFENGHHHRLDGPAIVYSETGRQVWCYEGLIHREGGPAIIDLDGHIEYLKHGQRHREDGPAVICTDGEEFWFHNGMHMLEDEVHALVNKGVMTDEQFFKLLKDVM